jgi:hypothetical protein
VRGAGFFLRTTCKLFFDPIFTEKAAPIQVFSHDGPIFLTYHGFYTYGHHRSAFLYLYLYLLVKNTRASHREKKI